MKKNYGIFQVQTSYIQTLNSKIMKTAANLLKLTLCILFVSGFCTMTYAQVNGKVTSSEEMINYFAYDYPASQRADPINIITEVSVCPWNKEHRLVHISVKANDADPKRG